MKLNVFVLILMASVVVGYPQKPDRSFIDKVTGLQEIGRIAQEGIEFRRPRLSPDGRWIALTSVSPEYALWIASMDDLKPRLLAKREDLAEIRQYSWSPDSQQIAYVDGRTVRLINVITKKVTSYTTVSPFMSDPVFNAEGNLAVVANTDLIGNRAALEGDVEKVKLLTPKDRPYLEVVSPNSRKRIVDDPVQLVGENIIVPYVFRPRGEIYLNINGEDRRITPVENSRAVAPCSGAFLSPDRQKLALQCIGMGSNLSIYEIATKKAYDLGIVGFGSWSPDSDWILCEDEISDGHTVFWNDIYIAHYTGAKRIKLARAKGTVHGASWGKDRLIAYDEEGKIVIGKLVVK